MMVLLNGLARRTFLFASATALIAMVFDITRAQSNPDDSGFVKDSYESKWLYTVSLNIDPTIMQIIADPRFSSEFFPMYELVYMATNPRSEIRRLPQLMDKLNIPELWERETSIVTDYTTILYPNKVGLLPEGTVEKQSQYVWWVASGFVGVRSGFRSNVGGIFLINMATDQWRPIPIVNTTGKGFTHAEWIDMNIDGHTDCVTIEGSNNINTLLWLEQPTSQMSWTRHAISAAEVNVGGTEFRIMKLPRATGKEGAVSNVIIVAGKTTGKLTAYWVDDPVNDWTRETKISSDVIASDGAYVGIEIVDLNNDGRLDILTSTSGVAGRRGSILAYEHPREGFEAGAKWRKHILAEWDTTSNYQSLSPGPAVSFNIQTSTTSRSQKPHILVSGMDDGKVYVLSPESWSPFLWAYKKDVIFTSDKRVGIPSVSDIDGDGTVEIFIPTDFRIHVMQYVRSASTTLSSSTFFTGATFGIVTIFISVIVI